GTMMDGLTRYPKIVSTNSTLVASSTTKNGLEKTSLRLAGAVMESPGMPPSAVSRPAGDPALAVDRVIDELLGPEPQGDLAHGRLGAVAAVDQVILLADREIAADRPGRRA